MEIKRITTTSQTPSPASQRPTDFDTFIGQEPIKAVLKTAIESAKLRAGELGHILFSGSSGFGKTTLAGILSKQMGTSLKVVTGYALSKPSELVSVLNSLDTGDILFIDEIHRLKPTIEEVLYIAMEDFLIDMVMPEGGSIRLPINPFTLIGATTKPESLSQPMKNRFIYQFHFMDYTPEEKKKILSQYLAFYQVNYQPSLLSEISKKVAPVPREIHNLAVKIRDYLISKKLTILTPQDRSDFLAHTQIQDGGMMPIHSKYLEILENADRPLGLKSLAIQLGVSEKTLEEDIEPLLLKLGKITKTTKGRILS
ncbi:MAG: AAA family ATPase [candidate division SR1 bacterium]|nr:AAA family ATPase [candidate division SR1 bacterium]